MKIAIPVSDDTLTFFGNAGHTPYFAVFSVNGSGMFRSFNLEEVRRNPRNDIDHDHGEEEHHECSHGEDDAEHVRQHEVMAETLEDCDYLVARRACKNTAKSMANLGIKIKKYDAAATKAPEILSAMSAQLV
jgi:predicted Fe-Mo cluster-binding NifX family protein